jgi:transposase
MEVEQQIKEKFEALSGYLNEAGLRIWVATEAKVLGRGGISTVSRATGMSRTTIYSGLKDLSSNGSQKPPKDSDRIRIKGGGRKKLIDKDLSLLSDLDALVEPMSRGDPMSPLRWTCKSTPRLAKELKEQGHSVSQRTVCDLLDQLGYSLQSTRKTREGGKNPDRDKQFQYIAEKVAAYQHVGDPVVSVDTKKKELIGDFKNAGQEWHPKGEPEEVRVYDFIDKDLGKVAPYGVYDITANQGWVSVGIDHDTAEFAVESIRRWWREMGSLLYGNAKSILITADCGGSNGYRVRLWRLELQKLADELGLVIRVCHFPPGTSKWNKIEHRMFCHITQNWRGRPLLSRQVVVNLIGNTTTNEGLEIHVALDENHYQAGIKVSDTQLAELSIMRDKFHGEWNYEFTPRQIHEGDNDLL